jgi:fucose 4-O-acetylase-like acetyltransferase
MVSLFLSRKFKFWSFVSMVLLVYVHGYNLELRYLQPWTIPVEPISPTGFFEYFLANGILRFRIPMLFIISGYLYALHDEIPNQQRVRKRTRTLFVPYLIWSLLGIGLTYVLELFPYTQRLISESHVVQIDNTRLLLHDYHWYEVLVRWVFFPVSYQLWFIRVLFIYNLAYPAIRWCVAHHKARIVFFSLAASLWLATAGFILFEGEGLLFFSLGVWIQKTNFDIESSQQKLNPKWWGIALIVLAIGKTWLAFRGKVILGSAIGPVLLVLHKLTVFAGLVACWYGLDELVKWCMNRTWFVWLSAFSFIIYAMHAPLIAYLINGSFEWLQFMNGYRLITFLLLPIGIIIFCISVGAVLRKASPKIYGLLTGGRGL